MAEMLQVVTAPAASRPVFAAVLDKGGSLSRCIVGSVDVRRRTFEPVLHSIPPPWRNSSTGADASVPGRCWLKSSPATSPPTYRTWPTAVYRGGATASRRASFDPGRGAQRAAVAAQGWRPVRALHLRRSCVRSPNRNRADGRLFRQARSPRERAGLVAGCGIRYSGGDADAYARDQPGFHPRSDPGNAGKHGARLVRADAAYCVAIGPTSLRGGYFLSPEYEEIERRRRSAMKAPRSDAALRQRRVQIADADAALWPGPEAHAGKVRSCSGAFDARRAVDRHVCAARCLTRSASARWHWLRLPTRLSSRWRTRGSSATCSDARSISKNSNTTRPQRATC